MWSGYAGNFYIVSQPKGCELITYNHGEILIVWTPNKASIETGKTTTCMLKVEFEKTPSNSEFIVSFDWHFDADMRGDGTYLTDWIFPEFSCSNQSSQKFIPTPLYPSAATQSGSGTASYSYVSYSGVSWFRIDLELKRRFPTNSQAVRLRISNFKIMGKRYRF